MIFTESTIKISNNVSKMDSTIVLYRGDKNVEIRFTILQSPFKYSNTVATNVIESTNASYGQLVIKTPNDKPPIFSEVSATKEGTVLFTITKEMIDEIEELGVYTFQIRLMDENKQSRVTIPPVENGIEIKEPIAIEDDNTTNVVGLAKANYAVATLSDVDTPAFDDAGKYNKTNWNDGDIITSASLNKIEDGIYATNENVNTKSVFTNTQLDNKFGALNFTGSLNTGLNKSMTLSEAFPDILDGKYDAIKQCKLTVKVDGATIVNLTENYNMVQWQMYDNDNNLLSTAYSKPKVVRNVYFAPNDYVQLICWLDATYTPGASGSGISYDTPGYITVMLTISRSKNTEEYINKIKNLRITTTLRSLNVLVKDNKVVYTPKEAYNPATKKYVDDNILLEQLPILRIDETKKRIYVNCNNMGTYKKYFVPNKYANVYGFSFIYTNEDSSETEIALIGGAMTRDDFILCARNTNTLFILILGGTDRYTYTKSTKTLEKGLYGYLKIGNTQEYTPTTDYNPATKKYVDDNTVIHPLPIYKMAEAPTMITYTVNIMDLKKLTTYGAIRDINSTKYQRYHFIYPCDDGTNKTIVNTGDDINDTTFRVYHYDNSSTLTFNNVRYSIDYTKHSTSTDIIVTEYIQNYLGIYNTREYTPTEDYHPATKKYVDDKITSLPQLSFNEAGELVVTINGVSKTFVPKNV